MAATVKTVVAVETVIAEQEVLLNALAAMTTENGRLSVLTNDLEIIGELNPNGIFRTDADGKVTYANKEWFNITGLSMLGDACDHWLDRVEESDRADVRADWEAALRHPGGNLSREFRFRRPEGTVIVWINGKSLAESPVSATAAAPPVRAVIGAFTDVTHWREREQQEIAALTELANAQRHRAEDAEVHRHEQERYIDVVCHEIRNPLNGIVNNVDQLREGRAQMRQTLVRAMEDGPARQSILAQLDDEEGMLGAIDLCAQHQRRITDDILQISRLRLGRYILEETCFWMDELVGNAVRMFHAEAQKNNVDLEYLPQQPRTQLRGDAQRISQIIVNLLANAIKFTKLAAKRRVSVEAGVDVADGVGAQPGRRALGISVRDSGIGMTAEERAKLFVPFGQASARTHVTYGGSGMGLFITKELLELMGGSIRVESTPGHGTTFSVEVPIHLATDVPTSPSSAAALRAGALSPARSFSPDAAPCLVLRQWPLRILVVDDNDINRTVLVRHLNALPGDAVTVVAAGDGEEAVEAATRDPPVDLVFMDVEMPVMDGLEATRHIRAFEAAHGTAPVPIVGLSGNARQEHVREARASGMTDYLIKPYNRAGVMRMIERLLGVSLPKRGERR